MRSVTLRWDLGNRKVFIWNRLTAIPIMDLLSSSKDNGMPLMIRDLSLDYPDFLIASSEWFAFIPAKERQLGRLKSLFAFHSEMDAEIQLALSRIL